MKNEESWSSFVIVPNSGEASFVSGSESRVHFSDGSGTGRYEGWNFNSGNYLFTTDTK